MLLYIELDVALTLPHSVGGNSLTQFQELYQEFLLRIIFLHHSFGVLINKLIDDFLRRIAKWTFLTCWL